MAAELAQQVDLVRGFDPFGDDPESQIFPQGHGGADDGGVLGPLTQIVDQRAVDFQAVHRQLGQIRKCRVPRSVVVDGDPDAEFTHPGQDEGRLLGIFHQRTLRDLQADQAGRNAVTLHCIDQHVRKLLSGQVPRGHVDRHRDFDAEREPCGDLRERGVDDPAREVADESGLFRERNEF